MVECRTRNQVSPGSNPPLLPLGRLADYNKVRDTDAKTAEPDSNRMNHAVALAVLVTYNEEARADALVAPVFVLADLAAIYTTRMEQLGTIITGRVYSTKLNNKMLRYFPDQDSVLVLCTESHYSIIMPDGFQSICVPWCHWRSIILMSSHSF